jgi:hypothetical protein
VKWCGDDTRQSASLWDQRGLTLVALREAPHQQYDGSDAVFLGRMLQAINQHPKVQAGISRDCPLW